MEPKLFLTVQLKKLQRERLFNNVIKFIVVILFIILCPFLIIDKLLIQEYSTLILMIIAELFFIGLAIVLFNTIKENISFKNNRIIHCLENPDKVTEIIISPNRILFEIKGMEDDAIFLRNSNYKNRIIDSIKLVFGNSKIINKV